jgi:hypothetical protein
VQVFNVRSHKLVQSPAFKHGKFIATGPHSLVVCLPSPPPNPPQDFYLASSTRVVCMVNVPLSQRLSKLVGTLLRLL